MSSNYGSDCDSSSPYGSDCDSSSGYDSGSSYRYGRNSHIPPKGFATVSDLWPLLSHISLRELLETDIDTNPRLQDERKMSRLHRDLKEIHEQPLQGIQVVTNEEQMSCMCLILAPMEGCFRGLKLHLRVSIPDRYPSRPPKVSIQTPVEHPNVVADREGYHVCCDLLESLWTPGYLLKYLFLNLLILFSQAEAENSNEELEQPKILVSSYICNHNCGFSFSHRSWKEVASAVSSTIESNWASSTSAPADDDDRIPVHSQTNNAWLLILDRLSEDDIFYLCAAFPNVVGRIARANKIAVLPPPVMTKAVCFYLRKTYRESVLGVGVDVGVHVKGHQYFCIPSLEVLSEEAFCKYGVRQGVNSEDKFKHFLPLALSPDHFSRAFPIILHNLDAMHQSKVGHGVRILKSIPSFGIILSLMNQMILDLLKVCDENTGPIQGGRVLRASERALEGYCLLLHLLITVSDQHPELREEAQQKFDSFMQDSMERFKLKTPNLGEFIAFLPLVVTTHEKMMDLWPALSSLLLEELLQRKATRFLKQWQYLSHVASQNLPFMLAILLKTFQVCKPTLRILMFQAKMVQLVVREREKLGRRYGYPTEKMKEYMFGVTTDICMVMEEVADKSQLTSKWQQMFKILRFDEEQQSQCEYNVEGASSVVTATEVQTDLNMLKMLARCVVEGQRKGYDLGKSTGNRARGRRYGRGRGLRGRWI